MTVFAVTLGPAHKQLWNYCIDKIMIFDDDDKKLLRKKGPTHINQFYKCGTDIERFKYRFEIALSQFWESNI